VALASHTLKNYALAFAGSAIVANALVGERGLVEIVRARQQSRALAQKVTALRIENAALRVEAQRLRSDPLAIEAIARKELGLARPDEQVVLVLHAR
jgi:cell division protein FtsB